MKKNNNIKIIILKIKRLWLRIPMNFGECISDIIPYQLNNISQWFYHTIHGNAFRKILKLDEEIYEMEAITWTCNTCGGVVFKGNVKDSIIMNCPHCKSIYKVRYDCPHKFKKRELIRSSLTTHGRNNSGVIIELVTSETKIKR